MLFRSSQVVRLLRPFGDIMKRVFFISSNVPFFFDGIGTFTHGNAIDHTYDNAAFNEATRKAIDRGRLTRGLHVNPDFREHVNDFTACEILTKHRKYIRPELRVPLLQLPGFEAPISNVPYWDANSSQLIVATQYGWDKFPPATAEPLAGWSPVAGYPIGPLSQDLEDKGQAARERAADNLVWHEVDYNPHVIMPPHRSDADHMYYKISKAMTSILRHSDHLQTWNPNNLSATLDEVLCEARRRVPWRFPNAHFNIDCALQKSISYDRYSGTH